MTYNVFMGTLNPTHSLTHSRPSSTRVTSPNLVVLDYSAKM